VSHTRSTFRWVRESETVCLDCGTVLYEDTCENPVEPIDEILTRVKAIEKATAEHVCPEAAK
jgi:transcription initiation factor IIE alpha subunit